MVSEYVSRDRLWRNRRNDCKLKQNNHMTPDEPTLLRCEWCGKDFPAHPEAFIETGMSAELPPEDPADAWKGREAPGCYKDLSPEAINSMKAQMNLSDEQLEELIETGSTDTGVSIVCLECQDSCVEEDQLP